jgi:hypothetical protein
MLAHRSCLILSIVLALAVSRARADHHDQEDVTAHSKHPMRTVVLDNVDIRPSTLNMERGDALVFENHSTSPITVTFTEPSDIVEKIRCGLVRAKPSDESMAPWQLFAWENGKLTATIPPGRFASVCSLMAGTYVYTTSTVGVGAKQPGAAGRLPEKAQIVVK